MRNQPVFSLVQQGWRGSPRTFFGLSFSIGAIMAFIQLPSQSSTSKKNDFLRDLVVKRRRVVRLMGEFLSEFSGWLWGNLLYLLLGGGAFFALTPHNERSTRQGDGLEKKPSSVSHQSSV